MYLRLPHRVTAELLRDEWTWITPSGDVVTARAGDYKVADPVSGLTWSITKGALASGYLHAGGEHYQSTGSVEARQVAVDAPPASVTTSEGSEIASPGDWIVTDRDGNCWVVDDTFFSTNYVRHPRG